MVVLFQQFGLSHPPAYIRQGDIGNGAENLVEVPDGNLDIPVHDSLPYCFCEALMRASEALVTRSRITARITMPRPATSPTPSSRLRMP